MGYLEEGQDPDEEGRFVVLCGDLSQLPPEELEGIPHEDIISDEACVGGGNTISFERRFARGTRLAFFFARASVTDEDVFEVFYTSIKDISRFENDEPPLPEDFETLATDRTNSAWYTFGGAGDDGQDDDADMPDEMPDTGAGAAAAPLAAGAAAAFSLLALSALSVVRRR